MMPEAPPPKPMVMSSDSMQVFGIGFFTLLIGAACLWAWSRVAPGSEGVWAVLVIGLGAGLGGTWMLVFSPWWRVEMDPHQARIIADSGTRFSKKRRVLPYSAVERLEVRSVGQRDGSRRYALFLLIRDGSALQLGNWGSDRSHISLDEMIAARALGDALPEDQRPPRMFSPAIGGGREGRDRGSPADR